MSCDLTEAITEGNTGGIILNVFYTLAGGAASWFLFTNAALHVGWAPTDELLGLQREHWAMIMAALVVLVVFALSARRKRNTAVSDLQAIGRAVTIMLPRADDATRLRLLSAIANEASKSSQPRLPAARIVEAAPGQSEQEQEEAAASLPPAPTTPPTSLLPARGTRRLKHAWNVLHGKQPTDERDETAPQRAEEHLGRLQEPAPRLGDGNMPATPQSGHPLTADHAAAIVAAFEQLGYHVVPKDVIPSARAEGEIIGDQQPIQAALERPSPEAVGDVGQGEIPPLPGVRESAPPPLPEANHRDHPTGTFVRFEPGSESANGTTFRPQ